MPCRGRCRTERSACRAIARVDPSTEWSPGWRPRGSNSRQQVEDRKPKNYVPMDVRQCRVGENFGQNHRRKDNFRGRKARIKDLHVVPGLTFEECADRGG